MGKTLGCSAAKGNLITSEILQNELALLLDHAQGYELSRTQGYWARLHDTRTGSLDWKRDTFAQAALTKVSGMEKSFPKTSMAPTAPWPGHILHICMRTKERITISLTHVSKLSSDGCSTTNLAQRRIPQCSSRQHSEPLPHQKEQGAEGSTRRLPFA